MLTMYRSKLKIPIEKINLKIAVLGKINPYTVRVSPIFGVVFSKPPLWLLRHHSHLRAINLLVEKSRDWDARGRVTAVGLSMWKRSYLELARMRSPVPVNS